MSAGDGQTSLALAPDVPRVHRASLLAGFALCDGSEREADELSEDWNAVTCPDCDAVFREWTPTERPL